MNKHRIKSAIYSSFQEYYDKGLTSTAWHVRDKIFKDIDKLFAKKNK